MKKNKKILAFACSLLFSILFAVLYKWIKTGNPFTQETIALGTIIFLNLLILGTFGYKLFKISSGESPAQLKKKIVHRFIIFILGTFLISFLILSLGSYLLWYLDELKTDNFIKHLFQVEFQGAIKQFYFWILIASAFLFYSLWKQTIDREQKLREENLKYQYRTLKTQVNPHFLFNSLNTLSELVYVDAKKADNYIRKLSGIYRYILDNEKNDLICLSEEIEFVKQYFDLQKERDDNKIRLEIDVCDSDRFKIIPVSLQISVENAFKHNSISEESPLIIHIYNETGYVVVTNNIQRKNVFNDSFATGLPNLKERAKLITGKDLIACQENNQFIVKLPVVSIK